MVTFEEKIRNLASKAERVSGSLETEEATKNALIMPFIAALGYDVFDPDEVIPEFTADVGIKRGEKVDYALRRDGEIIILIEAKKVGESLDSSHSSQLFRYFTVTKARIAILTNGLVYRFFSDLDEPNKMDETPFLELDLGSIRDNLVVEVSKLSKDQFHLDSMLSVASDLKAMSQIRSQFERQFESPDDDFVRFFFQNVNPNGRMTQTAKAHYSGLVRHVLGQTFHDKVNDRLRLAMTQGEEPSKRDAPVSVVGDDSFGLPVVTTAEELEGFQIVRALICDIVPVDQIGYRDTKQFFGVFMGSSRKVLCRLYFNKSKKFIGILDDQKKETKHPIEDLKGIFGLRDQLRETAQKFLRCELQT